MIGSLSFTLAQINPLVGDVGYNTDLVAKHWQACASDLILFPECVLSGYPADDLILNPSFLACVTQHFEHLVSQSLNFSAGAIITLPWIENGLTYNAAFLVERGKVLGQVLKHNLPNYGTFDDKRVFVSGSLPEPIEFRGQKIGILVCEDTWLPEPALHLKKQGATILLSANASPFEWTKHPRRHAVLMARVRETGLPLIYVNQVSGHDDLLYDGGSCVLNATGDVTHQLPFFEECVFTVPSDKYKNTPFLLDNYALLYQALCFGLKEYVRKNGFKTVIIGLSGGIDSALTAAISVDALGADHVRCVMMPSRFTSPESLDDAQKCASLLGVAYDTLSIEPPLMAYERLIPLSGLAHENIQSRIRGAMLMALSNQTGAMVVTTGNKSEMAVGYATLYGDMCGGYNALKDIYKTDVFKLARWRNTQSPAIPEPTITRPPTAELKAGQTDQDSLPPYDILDKILYGLIEDNLGINDMVARGFDRGLVMRVLHLLDMSEYKRKQAAPGAKVSRKAFGRDRRYPIVNGFRKNIER